MVVNTTWIYTDWFTDTLDAANAHEPPMEVDATCTPMRRCKRCEEPEIPGTHLVYNLCRGCRENEEEKEWSWGR